MGQIITSLHDPLCIYSKISSLTYEQFNLVTWSTHDCWTLNVSKLGSDTIKDVEISTPKLIGNWGSAQTLMFTMFLNFLNWDNSSHPHNFST